MHSKFEKQLNELLAAEVITATVAQKITAFYTEKQAAKPNRLFTIFGVLGALLSGLGIILIIAHNWDNMGKNIKTIFAFLPLLVGQIACAFSVIKKKGATWVEASTTFLILAVGATISLIGQVYHIPGDLSAFLLVWIAITAPLLYLMRSNMAFIVHLVLSTWYACDLGYFYNSQVPFWYLLQLAWVLPHYIKLQKFDPDGNSTGVLNWLLPLSLVITLGTFTEGDTLAFILYMGLFGLLYNIGQLPWFKNGSLRRNGPAVIGSLGTVFLAITMSFQWFWNDAAIESYNGLEVVVTIAIFVLGGFSLAYSYLKKQLRDFNLFRYVFLIVGVLYLLTEINAYLLFTLMNVLVVALGLFAIRIGIRKDSYGVLNYGLLIITVLIGCRFFDTDLDFVVRGLLFIAVGGGFFFANYLMLKKQRKQVDITSNTK